MTMNLNRERDYTTHEGAKVLAKHIEQYWADCGYPGVKCRLESKAATVDEDGRASRGASFMVRSNLVNGLPPR